MGRTWLAVLLLTYGCGSDSDDEDYATYQECFDQHIDADKLSHEDAIVDCCTKHKIAGLTGSCGLNKADCINFITANLDQLSASTVEVMAACEFYEMQGGGM